MVISKLIGHIYTLTVDILRDKKPSFIKIIWKFGEFGDLEWTCQRLGRLHLEEPNYI
jgi:hypothetical protein